MRRSKKKRIIGSGRVRQVLAPELLAYFCFFGAAFFWPSPNFVWTLLPSVASISLDCWAYAPVGASSRYFWNASIVPGAGVILPSGSILALLTRVTPY